MLSRRTSDHLQRVARRRSFLTNHLFPLLLGGFVLLGTAAAPDARADWVEDFDLGFAQSWTFAATDDIGDSPATGVSTFEIVEAGANDYLRISHNTIGFRDGGGGATDGFGYVSESFTDVAVSAEINSQPGDGQQSLLGVLARANPVTGTTYGAGVNYATSVFAIGRSNDFEDFLFALASDSSMVIDPNAAHIVQLWVVGSNLTARLIDVSTSEVLSTLTATDGLYSSGFSGVLVETDYDFFGFPTGTILGTFDEVKALPEPGFAVLLVAGVLLLTLLSSPAPRARRLAAIRVSGVD